MTFGQSIHTCFIKYFVVSGRATRSEYWWFFLFLMAVGWGIQIGTQSYQFDSDISLIEGVWTAITFIPWITVSVRRLHDVGRSGWWLLLYFTIIGVLVVLYWRVCPSRADNKYGVSPLGLKASGSYPMVRMG